MGSIPFGKIISSQYGVDIQSKGSGNIGFANVRRVVGWQAGVLTLLGDVTKGFIPVFTVLGITHNQTLAYFVGLSAVIGHIFPIWLRFKGGKGIATGLGLIFALYPVVGIAGSVMYLCGCLLHQKSSTASLWGVAVVLIIGISLNPSIYWQYVVLCLISLYTLRHNLRGTVPNYG